MTIEINNHIYRWRLIYLGLGSCILFYATGRAAARRSLWFDELLTFYISKLPDSTSVVRALLGTAENHPPFDFVARHLSLRVLGQSEFALRAPSIVALWVSCLCLWSIVSKRTSMVAGLVAFSALLTTLALNYAYEARPYAILLASACISLFAWQRSVENPKSKFAPALLAVSLAMGIYTHFYGIFNYIPLLVGETLRSFERRRISLPIIVSILVSLGLALGVYPFAVNARYLSEGFHTRNFDITTAIELYRMLLFNFTLAGAVSLVFVVIIAAVGRTEQTASDPARVPLYEVGAAITYCFIPFMIYVVARLSTNAIKDRYAIVTVIGFSLVAVYLTDMVWRKHRVSALAICLSFLLTSFYSLTTVARSFDYPGSFITGSVREFIDSADLPIVMSDGFKFLEVYHYVPRSRAKIYFFANRKDVPRYRDSDTIDIALTNIKKVEPLNTVDFSEFLSRHSKFLVYVTGGNEPRYWILRKLEDNHVKLVFRTMVDQGLVFLADSESSATAALR